MTSWKLGITERCCRPTRQGQSARYEKCWAAILGATALLLSGCAYVEQTDSNGLTKRTIALVSPINIIEANDGLARVVRVTGIGAGAGSGTFGLGYYRTSLIQLDPACRVVLIDNTAGELQNFKNLTGNPASICDDQTQKGK